MGGGRSIRLLGVLITGVLLSACTPYTLFASGEPGCEEPALRVAAGDLGVSGRSHANGDAELGEAGTIDGVVSATGDVAVADGVVLDPADDNPVEHTPPRTYSPVDIADYRPGGAVAALAATDDAYYDFTGQDIDAESLAAAGLASLPPGVYYTDHDVEIEYGSWDNTFVAEGRISADGLLTYWSGDPGQVLALAGHDGGCDDPGITVEGPALSFVGRITAPDAGVEIHASPAPCGHLTSSTEIGGTWVDIAAAEVNLGPLPELGGDRFVSVGCAIEP